MSNGQRSSVPAFGVSGGKRPVRKMATSTRGDVGSQPAGSQPAGSQPASGQPVGKQQVGSQAVGTIPVVDLKNPPVAKAGALILNKADNLLYYCTSRRWIPVAIADMENDVVKLNGANVEVTALQGGSANMQGGIDPLQNGGDVNISSGKGGLGDGEINLKVGGENAMKIARDGSVMSTVSRAEIENNEETVELCGTHGIVAVNIDIEQEEQISGTIKNSLLREESWLNITATTGGGGVPQVWLSLPQKGKVKWYLYCMEGILKNAHLHFEVRNSI